MPPLFWRYVAPIGEREGYEPLPREGKKKEKRTRKYAGAWVWMHGVLISEVGKQAWASIYGQ